MKIFIAADHKGLECKNSIKKYLNQKKIETYEIGLQNYDLDDYTDFAFKLGEMVAESDENIGILICGNGIGMSIAANKVRGIRAVRAVSEDDAFKAKNHNGANVLCLGSNLAINEVLNIVDVFITTECATLERHLRRINKIINYESETYNEL